MRYIDNILQDGSKQRPFLLEAYGKTETLLVSYKGIKARVRLVNGHTLVGTRMAQGVIEFGEKETE